MLWLWCRPAAVAPIRPLAWEPPYAAGAALKRQKKETWRKQGLKGRGLRASAVTLGKTLQGKEQEAVIFQELSQSNLFPLVQHIVEVKSITLTHQNKVY